MKLDSYEAARTHRDVENPIFETYVLQAHPLQPPVIRAEVGLAVTICGCLLRRHLRVRFGPVAPDVRAVSIQRRQLVPVAGSGAGTLRTRWLAEHLLRRQEFEDCILPFFSARALREGGKRNTCDGAFRREFHTKDEAPAK